MSEGWHGWDDYAAYYDWENARTLGRRDVPFWRAVLRREVAPTLELGCGTGRLLIPLARSGLDITGIDRSTPMLARASTRVRRLSRHLRPRLVRGDIRALPFPDAAFGVVLAPYGLLQSLVSESDLTRMLRDATRVLRPGGLLAVDLVPDLPNWQEYQGKVSLRGRSETGARITLVESVRQDHRRGLTIFDEEFTERSRTGVERRRRFSLTFRTLSLPAVTRRLARHGLTVEARYGDYRGGPLGLESDVWLMLARKTGNAAPTSA